MPTLVTLSPEDGARAIGAGRPVVAELAGYPGSLPLTVTEDSQAEWAAGTLTDAVATTAGTLDPAAAAVTDVDDTTAELGTGTLSGLVAAYDQLSLEVLTIDPLTEDFEGQTPGAFPSGFSQVAGDEVYSIVDYGGSRQLRAVHGSVYTSRLLWTAPGATADGRVDVKLTYAGANVGLLIRHQDPVNGYRLFLHDGGWQIQRENDSAVVASKGQTHTAGVTYHVSLEATGTTIRAKVWPVGGSEPAWTSGTDSTWSSGYTGVWTGSGTVGLTTYYDEWEASWGLKTWGTSGTREWGNTLASLAHYRGGSVSWEAILPTGCTLVVQGSPDGGSTWYPCTNGGVPPGLTLGQVLTGVTDYRLRIIMTGPGTASPILDSVTFDAVGDYPATASRVGPVHSIAAAAVYGDSRVSIIATVPAGAGLAVELALNGGSWIEVVDGDPVPALSEGDLLTGVDVATRVTMTSATGEEAVSVNSITIVLRPMYADQVSVVVDGVFYPVADSWTGATVSGGAIVEDPSTLTIVALPDWWTFSAAAHTVAVEYAGTSLGSVTWTADEVETWAAAVIGYCIVWATDPDWMTGAANGTYCVADPHFDLGNQLFDYLVLDPPVSSFDGFYWIAHTAISDNPGQLVVGALGLAENPGQLVPRGYLQSDNPGQLVVQADAVADNPGQLVPALPDFADAPGQLVVGVLGLAENPGQLVVYGVNYDAALDIEVLDDVTRAYLEALGFSFS